MKRVLLFLTHSLFAVNADAQLAKAEDVKKSLSTENKDTVAWLKGGLLNVGINQGFLHNWAAGGELASMTVNGLFNGYVTRLYHRQVWTNNLDLNYALFYAYSNSFVPRKMDDRIDFTSKYGVRLDTAKDFYLTALFNFKSQFTKGYDYKATNWDTFSVSNFLSPAYLTLALGLEYRKGSNLSLFFSPVAARMTLVDKYYTMRDPAGAFGVENGKSSRFELGAYFTGRYNTDLNKPLAYRTRVDFYTNYLAKDVTDATGKVVKKDNPGNIDWLWDNLLLYKANKFLTVSLGFTLMYDNDIPYTATTVDAVTGKEVSKDEPGEFMGWFQTKQIFTLGFAYKF
ncbi:MAG: DUF3078 domain-containing protein [Flavipsychrobacter sp.]|nr:DUF3078 domain-containing protein [Flavipsychrobacter sp.]